MDLIKTIEANLLTIQTFIKMKNLRTATKSDFKVGTTLIAKTGGWKFTLRRKYSEGIWECNGKCHFESAAKHYNVEA